MEIVCSHMTSSCRLVNLRQRFPEQSFSSPASKLPRTRKHKLVYFLVKETGGSLFDFSFRLRSSRWSRNGRLLTVNGLKNAESSVTSEGYSGYVLDGEGSLRDVAKSGQSGVRKILIPGLPEQIDGDCAASVSSSFTEWKPKFNIHYEKSGSENVNSPQMLFLPGFGVGSFHYEKQLKDLGRDFRVWALDFLGQGSSLPSEDPTRTQYDHEEESTNNSAWGLGDETQPWAENLVYSIDLWEEQVRYFVEEVIQEPVYLVGNSLGGYVALYFAARNPQLVKGITLLNATPFWGFLPNPVRSPILSRMFPWAGTFPLPARVKKLVQIVWEKISDPTSIREILKQVYADHLTNVDKVFSRILEVTEHPAAAASLASIMFAPQGELSFREALSKCQIHNVPICLMYGKEDPWVTPIWGLQVKRQLPEAPYYQISPAGHCPHDEVPEAINYLLRGWIKNLESQGSVALPLLNGEESIEYNVARDLEFLREGSKKSVTVQFYGSKFSLWGHISSFIHSQFEDLRIMFQ